MTPRAAQGFILKRAIPRAVLPAPAAPIPHQPAALVARLAATTRALDAAIDRWDKTKPPPRAVTLYALYQQRVLRLLARDPALAARVVARSPDVRDDVAARADLGRLTSPTTRRLRTGRPEPPQRLLRWYREVQRRFGVRWQLLAAVNFVETAFGKVRASSSAGAQGPMQFMPATWRAYGLGGDVHRPRDAILGAGNYLAANGGARDEARALYHYNPSRLYVDAVRRYARRIAADPHAFYRYYAWQVFVRTPSGDRRVTGP
jgi:membrane-bound lytic murein transglycosylase B